MREVVTDIAEDFDELRFLCQGYTQSLRTCKKSLRTLRNHPATQSLTEDVERLIGMLSTLEKQITEQKNALKKASRRELLLIHEVKQRLWLTLRSSLPLISALCTATEWQSPSFSHSLRSEAGVQEGNIIANINDYKRDQHLNEERYQQQFLRTFVDGFKFPAGAYLTSSGMAALTTIITYLFLEKKIHGPVLLGQAMYFENTEVLEMFFRNNVVIKVDEMDTKYVLQTYDEKQPDLLVFDSLCNAPTVAVPDLPTILSYVCRSATKETFVIVDNSTLSIALQPLKSLRLPCKIKLIVFESLNKYHQFGLDRVTAGIIWYRGFGLEKLYYARDHAGTNIPDSAVYALPKPDRKYLSQRLARLNRNTHYVADALETFISQKKLKKITAIIYPGLKSHPSFSWSKRYSFQGSYFVISFAKQYQTVRHYQRFVKLVLAIARKNNVDLTGGTSFGFNTTRVYLTARNSDYGKPFIRVAVGTEHKAALEKLTDVFKQTFQAF